MTIADIKRVVNERMNAEGSDTPRATHYTSMRVVIYLARKHTDASYPEIARAFGGMHHTTIYYHYESVVAKMRKDSALRAIISEIERTIIALMNPDYAAVINIAESGNAQSIPLTRDQLDAVRSLIASFAPQEEAA